MSEFDKLFDKHTASKDETMLMIELAKIFKACFEENPELITIGVIGHTPSFNDGDICSHDDSSFAFSENDLYDTGYYLEDMVHNINREIEEDCLTDKELEEFFSDTDRLSSSFSFGSDTVARIPIDSRINMAAIVPKGLTRVSGSPVERVLELLFNQDITSYLYETNYVVTATMVNGVVEIEQSDYWPEY